MANELEIDSDFSFNFSFNLLLLLCLFMVTQIEINQIVQEKWCALLIHLSINTHQAIIIEKMTSIIASKIIISGFQYKTEIVK